MHEVLLDFLRAAGAAGGKEVMKPGELFGEIVRQCPRFKGCRQHDALELLWTIIDLLRAEQRTMNKSEEAKEGEASGDMKGKKKKKTLIEDVFGGRSRSSILCRNCKFESVVMEPFVDLSLPLPERLLSRTEGPKSEASQAAVDARSRKQKRDAGKKEKQQVQKKAGAGEEAEEAKQGKGGKEIVCGVSALTDG